MELGLGESSSVQLSPQTPRAAQPFSAAPCFGGTACVPSPQYLWEHLKPPSSLAYFCIDSFQTWNSVFRMNVGFSWVLSKLPLRVSCCWSSAVSSALREARVRGLQTADAPVPSKSDPLGLIPLLKIIYRCVRLNS